MVGGVLMVCQALRATRLPGARGFRRAAGGQFAQPGAGLGMGDTLAGCNRCFSLGQKAAAGGRVGRRHSVRRDGEIAVPVVVLRHGHGFAVAPSGGPLPIKRELAAWTYNRAAGAGFEPRGMGQHGRQAVNAKVMPDGRLGLPADLRKTHGIAQGDEVSVEDIGDATVLRTLDQVVAGAQAISRKLVAGKGGASVDDFLADRAHEAEAE